MSAPVILNEIQNTSELLNWVRAEIDRAPSAQGWGLLTGSRDAPVMRGVSESMAGRAAVFHLPPLSVMETPKVTLLIGWFPEVLAQPSLAQT